MRRMLARLIPVLALSAAMLAQTRSATGWLEVTATVVSSSELVEQPDGRFRLVVANAPSRADVLDLQQAVNRLNTNPSIPSQSAAAAPVTGSEVPKHKRIHLH